MRLLELQERLSDLAWAPEARLDDLGPTFDGHPSEVARRLRVYLDAIRLKMASKLSAVFPRTAALLGDEAFAALVASLARSRPRDERTTHDLAGALPDFLRTSREEGRRADLGDLADLERTRKEVADEASPPPAAPRDLAQLAPQALVGARLTFTPALRLLRVDHQVAELWQRVGDGASPPPPRRGGQELLVWRHGESVLHAAVPGCETEALRSALAGASVPEVCRAFQGTGADAFDACARALQAWVADGLVVAITPRLH